jgi:hypothetical protein
MITETEPVTVTVSHKLGREEAKRRIESGLGKIRAEIAPYVGNLESRWESDYTLALSASAMMQTISGRIEVYDDFIKIELGLPRLLHLIGKTIAGRIEKTGAALLEGPKGKA